MLQLPGCNGPECKVLRRVRHAQPGVCKAGGVRGSLAADRACVRASGFLVSALVTQALGGEAP